MTTFKIKPFPEKLRYVQVHLFPTRKKMLAYVNSLPDYKGLDLQCHGLATSGRYYRNGKLTRLVGRVFLCDTFSRSEVVAHELLHIAIGLLKPTELQKIVSCRTGSCKMTYCAKEEEKLCHVLDQLVSSYWAQWHKRHKVTSKGDLLV